MIDSNRTLRFPRTSREAFGYQASFDQPHHRLEAWIYMAVIFAFGVLLGVLL
jgi:hypothetical protein